jgi:hypothetical protein
MLLWQEGHDLADVVPLRDLVGEVNDLKGWVSLDLFATRRGNHRRTRPMIRYTFASLFILCAVCLPALAPVFYPLAGLAALVAFERHLAAYYP